MKVYLSENFDQRIRLIRALNIYPFYRNRYQTMPTV